MTQIKSRSISTFQQSLIRFSCNTSRLVCVVQVTSIYFSAIVNDFCGMYMWSWGWTWWRRMKSPPLDQKSFRASASSFVSVGRDLFDYPWNSSLRTSLMTRFIPNWSRFKDFMISSKQFCCSSCNWEDVHPSAKWILLFRWSFEHGLLTRLIFPSSSTSATKISLPDSPPQPMHFRRLHLVRLSYQHLVEPWLVSFRNGGYSIIVPIGCIGPPNGSLNRLSQRGLRICQEILNVSKTTTAFHRIGKQYSHKPDCKVQQPSLYCSYCSLSRPVRPGPMGCWNTMIPWYFSQRLPNSNELWVKWLLAFSDSSRNFRKNSFRLQKSSCFARVRLNHLGA